jgi:hypothetical protein
LAKYLQLKRLKKFEKMDFCSYPPALLIEIDFLEAKLFVESWVILGENCGAIQKLKGKR